MDKVEVLLGVSLQRSIYPKPLCLTIESANVLKKTEIWLGSYPFHTPEFRDKTPHEVPQIVTSCDPSAWFGNEPKLNDSTKYNDLFQSCQNYRIIYHIKRWATNLRWRMDGTNDVMETIDLYSVDLRWEIIHYIRLFKNCVQYTVHKICEV